MRMEQMNTTALVDVEFFSRSEARVALDELELLGELTIDIVRCRVARGDVAYELLICGPSRDVRQAVRRCAEWAPNAQRALARAC